MTVVSATALQHDTTFGLSLVALGNQCGVARQVTKRRVQRPGLALAGFLKAVRDGAVQVLGVTEMRYVETLTPEQRRAAFEGLASTKLAAVVITSDMKPPIELVEACDAQSLCLFGTALGTESFINRLHGFLDEELSEEIMMHGVMLDVFGVGLMLTGKSGIGKSECALDLVLRGHRLIADDAVLLKERSRMVFGKGPAVTQHHMEIRGLGIINVRDLFGAAAVSANKSLDLIIELIDWSPQIHVDRLGLDDEQIEILGLQIAKVTVPIRPGRNVASIVEVAARNLLLKSQGHHSARDLQQALEQRLNDSRAEHP